MPNYMSLRNDNEDKWTLCKRLPLIRELVEKAKTQYPNSLYSVIIVTIEISNSILWLLPLFEVLND